MPLGVGSDTMFERAKEALQIEADSIMELIPRVDAHFGAALEMILHCPGRIIVTGMGKAASLDARLQRPLPVQGRRPFSCILPKPFTAISAW